jgi:hypothetical protein
MDVRMGSEDGLVVGSPEQMCGQFQSELMMQLPVWRERLSQQLGSFRELEEQIRLFYGRGGAMLAAGLLAEASRLPATQEAVAKLQEQAAVPLRPPERRSRRIQLWGGLIFWITTLYCGPRERTGQGRGKQGAGLYAELAAFGFGPGCSPAVQSNVARQVALCPSLQLARQELERQGLKLNLKTVRRIGEQTGLRLLTVRKRELLAWREGKVPAGNELSGKRVAVQIDGGRTRLRTNGPRASKKGKRPSFTTDWREPKLLTIFELDERGRMRPRTRAWIDGTFAGPDHLAELVAFHLHRLGAATAESVTFAADGAPWIWDRVPGIIVRVGIPRDRVHEVLDFCHAAHHISLALSAFGVPEKEHRPLYLEMRRQLRQGRWRRVVEDLADLAADQPAESDMHREVNYLRRHGEAGRLSYPTFRRHGLPLGSGAIESSIRRVINLRLKGNGIFWLEENAEAVLALRATVVCERWDETMDRMSASMARDNRLDWNWDAPDFSLLPVESANAKSPSKDLTLGQSTN